MNQQLLISKAQFIKQQRIQRDENDTPELQNKRKAFLDNLVCKNLDLRVLEMYSFEDDVIKSKEQIPQYLHEYKFCNTRKKLKNETIAEIDSLGFEESSKVLFEIAKVLLANKQPFTIFYAEGQRSFHIRIYNLDFLEKLKPFQREIAQKIFWLNVCGAELMQYLDKAVWQDDHYLPLEYSIHWKHGTPYTEFNSYGGGK